MGGGPSARCLAGEWLEDIATTVAFDYESHVLQSPKPDTLTPENLAADFLSVADASGAETFAYYGYSWLALSGLQLCLRTNRLSALAMGGFPPFGGPYAEMLEVTAATHRMAAAAADPERPPPDAEPGDWSSVEVTMSEPQTRQFLTLYGSLQSFDDRAALSKVTCPRLCFAGTEDQIVYDERWGGVEVDMVAPLREHRNELEAAGWTVRLLDGLDHIQAMQAASVIPLLRAWLPAASV